MARGRIYEWAVANTAGRDSLPTECVCRNQTQRKRRTSKERVETGRGTERDTSWFFHRSVLFVPSLGYKSPRLTRSPAEGILATFVVAVCAVLNIFLELAPGSIEVTRQHGSQRPTNPWNNSTMRRQLTVNGSVRRDLMVLRRLGLIGVTAGARCVSGAVVVQV